MIRLHAKEIFKATTNHTYVQQKGKLSPLQPVARRHSITAVRDNVSLILNIIIFFDNTNLTKKVLHNNRNEPTYAYTRDNREQFFEVCGLKYFLPVILLCNLYIIVKFTFHL